MKQSTRPGRRQLFRSEAAEVTVKVAFVAAFGLVMIAGGIRGETVGLSLVATLSGAVLTLAAALDRLQCSGR